MTGAGSRRPFETAIAVAPHEDERGDVLRLAEETEAWNAAVADRRDAARTEPGQPDAWASLRWEYLRCEQGCSLEAQRLTSRLLLHRLPGRTCVVTIGRCQHRYTVRADTFDYFPAGTRFSVLGGPSLLPAVAVSIPVGLERALLQGREEPGPFPVRCQFKDRRLQRLVEGLAGLDGQGQRAAAPMRSAAIVDRLFELGRRATETGGVPFSGVLRRLVAEYIDLNIGDAVTLEGLASLTGLGRTEFARLFRATFSLPIHAYVVSRRIALAKLQLTGTTRVTQIAHDLGFSSHAHFATTFRKFTGQTPTEFRDAPGRCVHGIRTPAQDMARRAMPAQEAKRGPVPIPIEACSGQ